ncbi:HAMP domain-containing sensor histidine kinase [Heyndrickxia sp. NPDC080065]|uniref:HAMP domain-containing sensor histidine kinase n=1 Tax=Heyndrickxia sp. NPDC080065 TaxID=3390568 RepID=UPI003D02C773
MKFRHSLLAKFLLIILIAILFIPIVIPVTSLIFYFPFLPNDHGKSEVYYNGNDLERMWHKEAEKLSNSTPEKINNTLLQIKGKYPDSKLFWVDQQGQTQLQLPEQKWIPNKWSASFTVDFMKKSYDNDPFTTVAFIGSKKENRFMVFQMPRNKMKAPIDDIRARYDFIYGIGLLCLFVIFIFLSWLFVYKLRKRLLHLRDAMDQKGNDGIPEPVPEGKKDEIGQLEHAFNRMIYQLKEGRTREQEEEKLRRQLIANLSHDLRTPLTTLRGHAYSLNKENLSEKGKESVELIDRKITYIGQLVDNLFSYTLLSAGKYPFHPQSVDVLRKVRMIIATWYPVFEKEGFDVEIDLPEKKIEWTIDPGWFERVLDNLFQNILRHTKEGKYIGIIGKETEEGFTLIIEDHGPGLKTVSEDKGAGIGLSIVSLMLNEMNLFWSIDTSESGTKINISNKN